ncbi:hypothetical protein TNCV_4316841 [Trichonephila clavipes]|nr:hypothetical protein TNCV_4316841 [Trichonephila clavipes]
MLRDYHWCIEHDCQILSGAFIFVYIIDCSSDRIYFYAADCVRLRLKKGRGQANHWNKRLPSCVNSLLTNHHLHLENNSPLPRIIIDRLETKVCFVVSLKY